MTDSKILIQLYRIMQTIREFENQIAEQYWDFQINLGEMHFCRGQEAIAAGVLHHLRTNDAVEGTHRSFGHIIAKGVDLRTLTAEVFGKITGLCKGKGGHMHLFDQSINFGCSGIVGASMPLALGPALKAQLENSDRISVAFFGDGAVCQGMFHESLNLASIWKLPVLFVCENNQWAISTPYLVTSPVTNVADRAGAYGIKGMICNGNDVLDVYQTAGKAIDFIRTKKEPILLEAKTYRLAAHFEGDIESYKSEEEQEAWEHKDPIPQFEKSLIKRKILTGETLRNLHQEIKAHVKDAVDFAIQSPYPPPKLAFQHVFHEERKD